MGIRVNIIGYVIVGEKYSCDLASTICPHYPPPRGAVGMVLICSGLEHLSVTVMGVISLGTTAGIASGRETITASQRIHAYHSRKIPACEH